MPNNSRLNKTAVAMGLLAFLVIWGAYSNFFHNNFQFDDYHVIVNNLYIRDLHNIPKFFADARTATNLPENAVYRPLGALSFAIDYQLGKGLDPRQFHITQLALLMILGTMLFFFFWRLMAAPWLAFFASLFFCVHTANTETMNIISARSELLSTIGLVGSFLMYLYLPQYRRFFLYLIPMVIGALAKPPAVMFAPLLLVYIVLFEGDKRTAFRKTVPAFAVGLIAFVFVDVMKAPSVNYGGGGRLDYLLTQAFNYVHYVRLFILPLGLTADSDWALLPHWYDTRFFAGILFLAGVLALIWNFARRPEMKPAAFGLIWFLLMLLPTSSIFPLAEVINEHRIFVPFIGLSLAVTWWVAFYAQKWGGKAISVAWVLATLILIGHAVGTFERNKVWKSEESLWFDAAQKSPLNARALMNYGITQMEKGNLVLARDNFEKAIVLEPNYAILESNLGIVYSAMGDFAKGEPHFQRALRLPHNNAGTRFYYAYWLQKVGRTDDAIAQLVQAISFSPGEPESRTLLMKLYSEKGDKELLRKLVAETLAIFPSDPVANGYAKEFQAQ